MHKNQKLFRVLIVLLALACTACGEQVQQAKEEAKQRINETVSQAGDKVNQALDEARQKLKTENLSIGGGEQLPKAEVTPTGDLLINGVALPMSEAQRTAMLAYREQLLALADAGMNMGAEGAQLAGQAVSQVTGLLDGKVEDAKAKFEAEAQRMAAAGLKLCEQAQGLETAQKQLAALIPEFAPYVGAIEINADCEGAAQALGDTAATEPAPAATEGAAGN
ncbi:MAG: hypothetical protein MUE46_15620 [Xanthomonadales bacterium]|jgi:hypothetical protein|nr:hypothetical protein [Xanthomonadales bacterium]